MDNIDAFNKAAVEYGLPESYAFPSNDLYEAHKGTFYKVIRCLDQLGVEVYIRLIGVSFQCRSFASEF